MHCNRSHDHQPQMGEIATICGQDEAKMDHSTGASLGKVSFLVLWHIWTNLAAIIAVNRWNVDHLLCCVRPRSARWPQIFYR